MWIFCKVPCPHVWPTFLCQLKISHCVCRLFLCWQCNVLSWNVCHLDLMGVMQPTTTYMDEMTLKILDILSYFVMCCLSSIVLSEQSHLFDHLYCNLIICKVLCIEWILAKHCHLDSVVHISNVIDHFCSVWSLIVTNFQNLIQLSSVWLTNLILLD